MGYDLTNSKGQEFRFDTTDFPKVLNLAEYFGWEPKSEFKTNLPKIYNWYESYFKEKYK